MRASSQFPLRGEPHFGTGAPPTRLISCRADQVLGTAAFANARFYFRSGAFPVSGGESVDVLLALIDGQHKQSTQASLIRRAPWMVCGAGGGGGKIVLELPREIMRGKN